MSQRSTKSAVSSQLGSLHIMQVGYLCGTVLVAKLITKNTQTAAGQSRYILETLYG